MRGIDLVFLGLLGLLLVPVAVIDLRQRRVPNILNLLIGLLGLAHAALPWNGGQAIMLALSNAVLAVLLLGGSTWLLRLVSSTARIGGGDLKFLVAVSLWVGWQGSIAVLFLASLGAIIVAIAQAPWRGLDLRRMHPFGPLLAMGMMAVVALAFLGHHGAP